MNDSDTRNYVDQHQNGSVASGAKQAPALSAGAKAVLAKLNTFRRTNPTPSIDQALAKATELLHEAFGMEVETRIPEQHPNDRKIVETGSCWIGRKHEDTVAGAADAGINCRVFDTEEVRKILKRESGYPENFHEEMRDNGVDPINPPASYATFFALVSREALFDRNLVNEFDDKGGEYFMKKFNTIEDALEFVRNNADTHSISLPPTM